jgi:hydrogenase large subunit
VTRLLVGPFNRVEGDIEIRLEVKGGVVAAAWAGTPLYRGFEQILVGRQPLDALVVAPRICGICSVSQSMAAAAALADLMGLEPPPNGRLAANLVHAAENLADHLTHFYLFFMPDFAAPAYADRTWHEAAARRFAAVSGAAAGRFLAARNRLMHVAGILAGKWPHSLALQPGGTTRPINTGERLRLLAILAETRTFLEAALFGAPLERIVALDGPEALAAYAGEAAPESADFRFFLRLAGELGLDRLGRGEARFLSYGAYRLGGDRHLFAAGLWEESAVRPFDPAAVAEDLTSAWLEGSTAHPADGVTVPADEKPAAYSWAKAPRLGGRPAEVGALARQVIVGQPLLRRLAAAGGSVFARVVARLVECAGLLPAMEAWAAALVPREPFCLAAPVPSVARGAGLVEAARGGLGHWLAVRDGRLAAYQIVSPTTWNFSPRDRAGTPGPVEAALVGAPVRPGEDTPIAVQHVVRSFDPCMVCTAH